MFAGVDNFNKIVVTSSGISSFFKCTYVKDHIKVEATI